MNTPPFQQLQAFLSVARHKSFSGAARELGVSRSAVSHTVRQLEEQLRVVLLARTTRSVSLTDAGRRLVDSAGPSLAQVAAALTEVSAQPGETVGRVRLSVPPTVWVWWSPSNVSPGAPRVLQVLSLGRLRRAGISALPQSWLQQPALARQP